MKITIEFDCTVTPWLKTAATCFYMVYRGLVTTFNCITGSAFHCDLDGWNS